jgi:hypothetical protein
VFVLRSISPFLFSLVIGLTPSTSYAQKRCGTFEIGSGFSTLRSTEESTDKFEKWIRTRTDLLKMGRSTTGPYRIPVVVHIIHNGEPIGTGTNISTAQVLSQLKVLNDDFRRQNADAVNTPANFAPLAGSMDIEFALAVRDPEGKSTDGIVRVKGSKAEWTTDDNYELKAHSYWPSEDYLNLWVCNLTDFLGYAQFPVSSLPGLEGSSNNELTDGVVLYHRAFGSVDDGNFSLELEYNKGRTATHEISHFFGLRHTWADTEDCEGTDYVDDTPNQAGYTRGCPTTQQQSCGVVTMYQNFVDYTDDACMNLFTKDQITRMQVVIENSPRRKSLLTSAGLLAPDPVPNDLGLREILTPALTQCSNNVVPVVEVKNYGSNIVSTVRVRFKLDGAIIQTRDVTLNLAAETTASISFNTLTVATGMHTIAFEILLTNGLQDGDAIGNDNVLERQLFIPPMSAVPFTQTFGTTPSDWTVVNPDQQITWEISDAPDGNSFNKAMLMRFFDYENNFGEQDILYSPVFNLAGDETATLLFDIAHARYDYSNDRLKVVAITGCGDISAGTVIYDSAGFRLETSPSTRSFFKPNSPDDWDREVVSLDAFAGQQFVQLAFIGINDYGNNVYLDNLTVITGELRDLSVLDVSSPSVVTCDFAPEPKILVKNTGTTTIDHILIHSHLEPNTAVDTEFTGLDLQPGQQRELPLQALGLLAGENNIVFEVHEVDLEADDIAGNNSITRKVVVNDDRDRIPLRQTFEFSDQVWANVNPTGGMLWQEIVTNYGTSVYFNAFNNSTLGDEAWLVSPVLDFSRAEEASVLFDLSYMQGPSAIEDLKVMVSTDCGNTYEPLDFVLPDQSTSSGSWAPQNQDDWFTNEIDLSAYSREPAVRIAFVVTNGHGNNLFLDNIEFFVDDDPRDITIDTQYSIFGYDLDEFADSDLKVGFNLSRRQDVKCQVVNTMGKVIHELLWRDVLNQVFDVPVTDDMPTGVYIVRLGINNTFFGERIFILK